jgi:hypothetical protein
MLPFGLGVMAPTEREVADMVLALDVERDMRLYSRAETGRTTLGDARLKRVKGGVVSYVLTDSQFSEGSRDIGRRRLARRWVGRGRESDEVGAVAERGPEGVIVGLSRLGECETGRREAVMGTVSGYEALSGLGSRRTAASMGCKAHRGMGGVGGTTAGSATVLDGSIVLLRLVL